MPKIIVLSLEMWRMFLPIWNAVFVSSRRSPRASILHESKHWFGAPAPAGAEPAEIFPYVRRRLQSQRGEKSLSYCSVSINKAVKRQKYLLP